jgi:hypothetical protein
LSRVGELQKRVASAVGPRDETTRISLANVVDRYMQVLPRAAHHAETYLQTIQARIVEQQIAVNVTRQRATASFFGGLAGGDARDVLVTVPLNPELGDYTMYHYGAPSGVNLAVGWCLTQRGSGLKKAGQVHWTGAVAAGLADLFGALELWEMTELEAMLSGIHQFAVMDAVYYIANDVKFSQDRITTKSAGFFGIG